MLHHGYSRGQVAKAITEQTIPFKMELLRKAQFINLLTPSYQRAVAFCLQLRLATIRSFRKAATITTLLRARWRAWIEPLKHINILTLCWEIISQLGLLSECDPFNCSIQKA